MANQEHVNRLLNNITKWNQWKATHPEISIDLSGVDLSRANLSGVDLSEAHLSRVHLIKTNLSGANLSKANLFGANLFGANFFRANLFGANFSETNLFGANFIRANLSRANLIRVDLSEANLSGANLSGANLIKVDLSRANLIRVDLSEADLSEADLSEANLFGTDLSEANLSGANLSKADLSETNLTRAIVGNTVFGECDLQVVKGLETIVHGGPSHLTINTIYKSKGNIPEVFLRGTGADDTFIEYMHSLTTKPIEYYTCFISYSHENRDFAERLYTDLQANNVRCWYAPEHMKIGDQIRQRIDDSIYVYDKLLLILSSESVMSQWVETEVETALEKEQLRKHTVLFPIRIDEMIMHAATPWATTLRRARHIGDFTHWKDYDAYQKGLQRLLRDLKQGE